MIKVRYVAADNMQKLVLHESDLGEQIFLGDSGIFKK